MNRPLRVTVFGRCWQRGREYRGRGPSNRGAYTAISPASFGYHAWSADTTAEPSRAGYGSFCFMGGLRAVAQVRAAFRRPAVSQVQIRTNQDRAVLIYNRSHDGRITCYQAEA